MPALTIVLEGEGAFPELREKVGTDRLILLGESTPLLVTALRRGMKSGAPAVAFKFDLPDGRTVFAETSLALFLAAADALRTKYGDPRDPRWAPGEVLM